jgi:hypothetical protein
MPPCNDCWISTYIPPGTWHLASLHICNAMAQAIHRDAHKTLMFQKLFSWDGATLFFFMLLGHALMTDGLLANNENQLLFMPK